MRIIDRDCTSNHEIVRRCLKQAQLLNIAVNTDTVPYIIPLCFGEEEKDGRFVFYFHKAREGTLNSLIKKECPCSFSITGRCSLFMDEEKRTCNMNYASFIGKGRVSLVESEDERNKAVRLIMEHYDRGTFNLDMRAMSAILIYRIDTDEYTVKATKGWRDEECL